MRKKLFIEAERKMCSGNECRYSINEKKKILDSLNSTVLDCLYEKSFFQKYNVPENKLHYRHGILQQCDIQELFRQ